MEGKEILNELQTLRPSAKAIKEGTGWQSYMVNDYLTMFENIVTLASYSGDIFDDLEIVKEEMITIQAEVVVLTDTVTTVVADIVTLKGDVITIKADILVVDGRVTVVETDLLEHEENKSAHGAIGDIVGTQDFAKASVGGTVLLAASVANATDSTVSVSAPDASAAPATYDQGQINELVSLTSNNKVATNQLVSDLNSCIAQLNAMIGANKTAKQMET
ncbi:MAG: hypothetical protein V3R25_06150 [Nitrosomonadaceae bacterium]